MEEKKRIKHKDMGHGTVVKENGDYYEIEWDKKPDFTQNGGRKVSSVPKDHVNDCCGGECGDTGCDKKEEEDKCDCGTDGMCSHCFDDDDWGFGDIDEEDLEEWYNLTEEELEELEEMLENWAGGIKLCLDNGILNRDFSLANYVTFYIYDEESGKYRELFKEKLIGELRIEE